MPFKPIRSASAPRDQVPRGRRGREVVLAGEQHLLGGLVGQLRERDGQARHQQAGERERHQARRVEEGLEPVPAESHQTMPAATASGIVQPKSATSGRAKSGSVSGLSAKSWSSSR